MNNFHKLIRNIDLIFDKVKDYFFITEFQSRGLFHDHELLWVQNSSTFGVSKNEEIECFVDKYLTTNQTMLSIEIHNMQTHQHKRTCKKKVNQFVDFNIQNHQ
jgi:DNA polymerase III delta subunit